MLKKNASQLPCEVSEKFLMAAAVSISQPIFFRNVVVLARTFLRKN
jgi:hypothetical protein